MCTFTEMCPLSSQQPCIAIIGNDKPGTRMEIDYFTTVFKNTIKLIIICLRAVLCAQY